MQQPIQLVWINEHARLVGGAERYIVSTALHLRATGVRSTLLYEERNGVAREMTAAFDAAFPIVDLAEQLHALAPDVVYAHQIGDERIVDVLSRAPCPTLRFFHDHELFCLRGGKTTTLSGETCTRTLGLHCYPCLGFARRAPTWPGLQIRSVSGLRTEQRAHDGLSGYVVGSRYMAEHVAAHGFDRAKIHVLPLFVEDVPAPEARREPDLLLFVGQLLRGKGLDVLFDALQQTRAPARLAVIGTGQRAEEWKARAAAAGVAGRVRFLGRLDHADVATWYARAACLIMPARAPETFGLVGVEAMSHGTPVIATRVGGIPEWLDDGRTGRLVASGDPAALAAAIDEVLGDPERARAMGEHGRARQRAHHRPEHHVQGLLALLSATAKARRAS